MTPGRKYVSFLFPEMWLVHCVWCERDAIGLDLNFSVE